MLLAVVIAILGIAPGVAAQSAGSEKAPRVELWGSVSASLTAPSGSLTSSYSPPALFFQPPINTATQTLTFDSRTGAGFEAGANFFLSPHAGFQIFADRVSMNVSGPGTPYELTLQYRQPLDLGPNPPFKTVNLHQSIPLPDSTGSLTQWVTAANAVVRLRPSGRVNATLSGGLNYYRMNGNVQPLGYTIYSGPSRPFALFSLSQVDYRLALALEPTNAFGFNTGGDVNICLRKEVAVVVGYRYLGGPVTDVATHTESIFSEALNKTIPATDLQNFGGNPVPPPARISVSGSRILVGLKWMR
jgi:hypothetical protein